MKPRATNDSGAALVLVLIIVTVLSLGLLAVISLSTTSIRTTVALRSQASDTYAADAAAQIAIDQVRSETFPCESITTRNLDSFYPASSTAPKASATVRCTPDPANGGGSGGSNSSPGSAVLTLGTAASEDGLNIDSQKPGESVKVRGGIFSNSTITVAKDKSPLENTAQNSYVYAMGNCTAGKIISTPAPVCNYSAQPQSQTDRRGKDPATVAGHGVSFDPPPAPSGAVQVPPVCGTDQVYELQPGLYEDSDALSALTNNSQCSRSIFHLNPGRYYLNFKTGTKEWTIGESHLVGGTPTAALDARKPPAMPGSCVGPGAAGSSTSSGVQLIFGGESRIRYIDDAHIELCASNSVSGPPIALYGLKQTVGSVPAQSGCVTKVPYNPTSSNTCAVLRSDLSSKTALTIMGTTYTPLSMIDINLNNNTVQVFRWGLITRGLQLGSTGSSVSLDKPVIDVPANAPSPFILPNIVYLDVFVCPGANTCSTSGTVQLRAKVLVSPDSPHSVKVLSWSRPT